MKKAKAFGSIFFALLLTGLFFASPQEANARCVKKSMKVGFIGICSGEGTSCIKYKGDCDSFFEIEKTDG